MSEQTRESAPLYSEEQVTSWLAFLARRMIEHDQTIFLIEQLQPSWLTKNLCTLYALASRLVWCVAIGLLIGLVDGVTGNDRMPVEPLSGLLIGLILGLFDLIRFTQYDSQIESYESVFLHQIHVTRDLIFWVIIIASIVLETYGRFYGLIDWLIVGLIGISFWCLRSLIRNPSNEIQLAPTIRFSWTSFNRDFKDGLTRRLLLWLIIGLALGLLLGVIVGTTVDPMINPIGGLIVGFFIGLTFGALFELTVGLFKGLISGVRPNIQKTISINDEDIWLRVRKTVLVSAIACVAINLLIDQSRFWAIDLTYGLLGGLGVALWTGGLDVIQHFLVRFLLWRSGSLPWHLAPFLDYAAEDLHFLQKVGGGYIFVHRYLLEHFAAMGEETTDG